MVRQRTPMLVISGALTVLFIGAAAYAFLGSRLSRSGSAGVEPLPLDEAPQALRLTITETGMVRVGADQIRQTNLPIEELSVQSVNLSRDGQPVPFFARGEGQDAALYFFAQAVTNTLEAPAVYWLSPGKGLAVDTAESVPAGVATEFGQRQQLWEDNETFLAQSHGNDVWLGKLLFAPSSLAIPLEGISPTGGPAELTIRIWSNNQAPPTPDHHVEIWLNGVKLGDRFWDGIGQETVRLSLPEGTLEPDDNVLTLTAPGDTGAAGEALYLDWVHLLYEGRLDAGDGRLRFQSDAETIRIRNATDDSIVLDITDPSSPVRLTGTKSNDNTLTFATRGGTSTYYVFSPEQTIQPQISLVPLHRPLTEAGRGADYVAIIAEVGGFQEALQPLLDFRRAQGLSVLAVPASQVFDEFGYGRWTPDAIRDFLAYAAAHWNPTPRFVLLVGDASYDIYNFSNGKNRNLMPTYLVYTEFAGYVASDTWFTIFEAESLKPALALGRFPAQTADQLENMVKKTLAYEQTTETAWRQRALLVADDEPSFDDASDALGSDLGAIGFRTEKLYMTRDENIHDSIINALNQGVGIINYVGHGSIEVWGDERVFQAADADSLSNGERPPIFTTFTCLNGYFNHPSVDALAEALMWAEDGGVVASIAPSGRSLTLQQLPLAEVFFERLLSEKEVTLGEALQAAKVARAEDWELSDVIHTFNLLGDPALRFQTPAR